MKILLKIAWRNIWRNPRRTWVLISSIAMGILGYLGTTSFSRGFLRQMVESTIDLHGGHIMVSAKGFQQNPQIRLFIPNPEEIAGQLAQMPGIVFAPLVSFQGMISSSESAAGVSINGVDPAREPQITVISRSIVQGHYLDGDAARHEILIGEALAEKLNVRVGEKVVLMVSDLENNINSGAYRIVGLYRTVSPDFDKAYVYLRQREAQELAGYTHQVTSFSIRLRDDARLEPVMAQLRERFRGQKLEVLSWKDRNPLLVLSIEAYDNSVVVIVVILFIAIAFSIVNSFLMVIYERIHELGIMMANGVPPRRIRTMLYVEAWFITFLGTLAGLLLSAAILGYLGHFGLDLTAFAKGLGKFGVGAIVYPDVAAFDVIVGLGVIFVVVVLSVIYPALKASRFEVVDAIRFV